ncbi:hypothetical protein PAMA_009210 [Pampus argenteus]
MADLPVPVASKKMMDVKLSELGRWLAARDFSPNNIFSAPSRGLQRFHNKYTHVKKGGIGGICIMLAGYITISYIWQYEHLKQSRWRKYH